MPSPSSTIPPSNRVVIPQPRYSPSSTTGGKWQSGVAGRPLNPPIAFDYRDCPFGFGFPMRDLSCRDPNALTDMMQGGPDQVMQSFGSRKIKLCIIWPGYPNTVWERYFEATTPAGPLTRCHLAIHVAKNYARFIEKNHDVLIDPQYAQWRVGRSGITLNKLVLVALWNVIDDVWQAEVHLDTL